MASLKQKLSIKFYAGIIIIDLIGLIGLILWVLVSFL